MRLSSVESSDDKTDLLAASRQIAAALCLIGTIGLPAASHAEKGPKKEISSETRTPEDLVGLSESLRIGLSSDADATDSGRVYFEPGRLIVRLEPRTGSQAHRAFKGGFASAMPGDPAAVELDELLRHHKAKRMRRIFEVYEDADGRQIDTARAPRARSQGSPETQHATPP